MANDNFFSRLAKAWNLFRNKDPVRYGDAGQTYSYRIDRHHLTRGREKTIINAVFNRIAMDVSEIDIRHVRLDDNDRFLEQIDSGLNYCLSVEANLDQTGRAFIQDLVISMLDEGAVATVATETNRGNPFNSRSFDIAELRTAKIEEWAPQQVRIEVYNPYTGQKEQRWVPKRTTGIYESPLYSVINEPNSTMNRLIRKLSLLDSIDEQAGAGKLDLIIQLPYVVKSPLRKAQAEERRREIETQLKDSKYGVAYTDGTEKVVQLNRPLENNLLSQIEFLTDEFYAEIGFSKSILDGTADEATMLNYEKRLIKPILRIISEEMKRKFLTPTAITQKQTIMFFTDPFSLIPVSQLAEMADKLTRNEIITSNEVRQIIGLKPSDDPNADELRNKNISQSKEEIEAKMQPTEEGGENQNEV